MDIYSCKGRRAAQVPDTGQIPNTAHKTSQTSVSVQPESWAPAGTAYSRQVPPRHERRAKEKGLRLCGLNLCLFSLFFFASSGCRED